MTTAEAVHQTGLVDRGDSISRLRLCSAAREHFVAEAVAEKIACVILGG